MEVWITCRRKEIILKSSRKRANVWMGGGIYVCAKVDSRFILVRYAVDEVLMFGERQRYLVTGSTGLDFRLWILGYDCLDIGLI